MLMVMRYDCMHRQLGLGAGAPCFQHIQLIIHQLDVTQVSHMDLCQDADLLPIHCFTSDSAACAKDTVQDMCSATKVSVVCKR